MRGELTELISAQFLKNCNYLSEGCDGGWAINHGFFAELGGLMPESCAAYTADTTQSCSAYGFCSPIARVTESKVMYNPTVEDI
jgi:hypothetical protein